MFSISAWNNNERTTRIKAKELLSDEALVVENREEPKNEVELFCWWISFK
jgi:hypothetical protein